MVELPAGIMKYIADFMDTETRVRLALTSKFMWETVRPTAIDMMLTTAIGVSRAGSFDDQLKRALDIKKGKSPLTVNQGPVCPSGCPCDHRRGFLITPTWLYIFENGSYKYTRRHKPIKHHGFDIVFSVCEHIYVRVQSPSIPSRPWRRRTERAQFALVDPPTVYIELTSSNLDTDVLIETGYTYTGPHIPWYDGDTKRFVLPIAYSHDSWVPTGEWKFGYGSLLGETIDEEFVEFGRNIAKGLLGKNISVERIHDVQLDV